MKTLTWVEISIANFIFNLRQIAKIAKPAKVIAVIKSNAYGHGLKELGRAASKEDIYGFAVSSAEEGIELRSAVSNKPILIFGAVDPEWYFDEILKFNLTPTVSSLKQAKNLNNLAKRKNTVIDFHLSVDTGLGREGVCEGLAENFIDEILRLKNVKLAGMYTHFATADTNLKKMNEQMALLKKVSEYAKKKGLDFIMHCANSAATIREAKTHFDAVRPGICLYGLEPFSGYEKKIKLKPLLTWKTKIALIKTLEAGATVSYGCTFTAPRKMQIAVLPIGYWDGYNRLLSNKGRVIIKDKYARVLGRVAMNMTMVDISSIKNAKVGDDVILIGKSASKQVSADEMAGLCGTIGYEIVCDINQNIKRVYD